MNIPGLGQAAAKPSNQAPTLETSVSTHNLQPNSEWRFEIPLNQSIELRVLTGTAELFGTELALNHTYTFRSGTKAAIYTWHGTTLEVTGFCSEYIAEETPMAMYSNVHFALEKLRDEGSDGPRVLVVGPTDSGKTSLVKLLTAYAVRMERQPMVVNTDPQEGLLSIPGSMTAAGFSTIVDVEQGWGSSPTSASTPVPVKLPLCYYYGHESPEDDAKMWKGVISRLALAVRGRLQDDREVRRAGIIVDTAGAISQGKNGFDLVAHLVTEFSINLILVMSSERITSDLTKRFSTQKSPIEIIKLEKSGGCIDRESLYLQAMRDASIKEYFFGNSRTTLSPHTQLVSFDDISIFKVNSSSSSAFPSGDHEDPASSSAKGIYEIVTPTPEMAHVILALPHATSKDKEEDVRDASVLGFVYVAEVDEKKRRLRILAPVTTRIGGEGKVAVWGQWPGVIVGLTG